MGVVVGRMPWTMQQSSEWCQWTWCHRYHILRWSSFCRPLEMAMPSFWSISSQWIFDDVFPGQPLGQVAQIWQSGPAIGPFSVHFIRLLIWRQPAYAVINQLILLRHAIEHVERPGESHEGVGRKKIGSLALLVPLSLGRHLHRVFLAPWNWWYYRCAIDSGLPSRTVRLCSMAMFLWSWTTFLRWTKHDWEDSKMPPVVYSDDSCSCLVFHHLHCLGH